MTFDVDDALRLADDRSSRPCGVGSMQHALVLLAGEVRRLREQDDAQKRDACSYVMVGLAVAAGLYGRKREDLLRLIGTEVTFATLVATLVVTAVKTQPALSVEDRATGASYFASLLDIVCERAVQ